MTVPEPITVGRTPLGMYLDALLLFEMGPLLGLLLGDVLPVVLEPAHPCLLAPIIFSWTARSWPGSGR